MGGFLHFFVCALEILLPGDLTDASFPAVCSEWTRRCEVCRWRTLTGRKNRLKCSKSKRFSPLINKRFIEFSVRCQNASQKQKCVSVHLQLLWPFCTWMWRLDFLYKELKTSARFLPSDWAKFLGSVGAQSASMTTGSTKTSTLSCSVSF